MLSENTDFELIPGDDDAWAVRILKGEFIETCIAFGEIKVDGTDKDPLMSFNFGVIESPVEDLDSSNNALQTLAGDILYSIMLNAIEKDELITSESK